jgi:hypothetical protein
LNFYDAFENGVSAAQREMFFISRSAAERRKMPVK